MFFSSGTRSLLKTLVVAGVVTTACFSGSDKALAFDDTETKEIQSIIKDYLLKNPELLIEMQQILEARAAAEQKASKKRILAEMQDEIYNSPYSVTIGNPDAKISVVEFYDYNCGYCRRAMEDMQKILAERDDVKFILKEFPVLGEASLEAHRVSLAFTKVMPEKAGEFHSRLLGANGRKDALLAMQVATELGADKAEIEKQMKDPKVDEAVQTTYVIADGLGISGTPSYILNDEVVQGAVGYDQLISRIEAISTN